MAYSTIKFEANHGAIKACEQARQLHADRTRGHSGHQEGQPDEYALVALLLCLKANLGAADQEIIEHFLASHPPKASQLAGAVKALVSALVADGGIQLFGQVPETRLTRSQRVFWHVCVRHLAQWYKRTGWLRGCGTCSLTGYLVQIEQTLHSEVDPIGLWSLVQILGSFGHYETLNVCVPCRAVSHAWCVHALRFDDAYRMFACEDVMPSQHFVQDASLDDVRKSYRKLARAQALRHHPDKNPSDLAGAKPSALTLLERLASRSDLIKAEAGTDAAKTCQDFGTVKTKEKVTDIYGHNVLALGTVAKTISKPKSDADLPGSGPGLVRFGDHGEPIQVVEARREGGDLPRDFWTSESGLAWTDLRGERLRTQDVKEANKNMDAVQRKMRELSSEVSEIWFVSWQHAGHIKALCPIALELVRRGHEVKFVLHDEVRSLLPAQLTALSAGRLPWSWDEELHFRQALWDPTPPGPPEQADQNDSRKAELSEEYFSGSQRSLLEGLNRTLHERPRDQWPALLAIDVSSVGAMDLAEKLQLRFAVISSWPVGPTLQSVGEPSLGEHTWLPSEFFAFTQSADQQSLADRTKRLLATFGLPWLMSWAGFHAPRRRLRAALDLGALQLLEAPTTEVNGGRPLVIILSHWGLDRPRPLPPRAVLVGPVEDYTVKLQQMPALNRRVEEWLQADNSSIVYISFGTNVKPKEKVVRTLLKAAEAMEDFRFLWDAHEEEVEALLAPSLSTASDGQAHVAALPANVLFAPGVPQLGVLASGRISSFVTHCGLNSVHEALHFGVPMLGLPFVGDQMVTARLIVESGAGLRLSVPNLEVLPIQEALRRLVFPSFREHAAAAGRIGRHAGGASSAADFLLMAQHGVGHLQMLVERVPHSGRLWDVILLILVPCVLLAALGMLGLRSSQPPDNEDSAPSGGPSGKTSAASVRNRKKRS
ncbi:UGT2B20 [Symbiodinium natans]|uniref:UGT2B20 protein n=1 Tax=Symbiodinium natans TaxID=878477 RepID=A0A812UQM6_9DINO|nr:UGT2B20 [Symbiodinium natans]